MIHKKIEKLIPSLNENFITYPFWEEGKYIPFVKPLLAVGFLKSRAWNSYLKPDKMYK